MSSPSAIIKATSIAREAIAKGADVTEALKAANQNLARAAIEARDAAVALDRAVAVVKACATAAENANAAITAAARAALEQAEAAGDALSCVLRDARTSRAEADSLAGQRPAVAATSDLPFVAATVAMKTSRTADSAAGMATKTSATPSNMSSVTDEAAALTAVHPDMVLADAMHDALAVTAGVADAISETAMKATNASPGLLLASSEPVTRVVSRGKRTARKKEATGTGLAGTRTQPGRVVQSQTPRKAQKTLATKTITKQVTVLKISGEALKQSRYAGPAAIATATTTPTHPILPIYPSTAGAAAVAVSSTPNHPIIFSHSTTPLSPSQPHRPSPLPKPAPARILRATR